MYTTDGTLFEHCSCGCNPGLTVNVTINLLEQCITDGVTVDECALRLANRPRGGPSAILAAARSMVTAGRIEALPEGWT